MKQRIFVSLKKEYGEGIGIKVCGDMDIDEQFEYRYYTPYFKGSGVTSMRMSVWNEG